MKRSFSRLLFVFGLWVAVGVNLLPAHWSQAQTSAAQGKRGLVATQSGEAASGTIAALLVSDIHFDPFHDPHKTELLVHAPVSKWDSILGAPDSADQEEAFAALQKTCHSRGIDTPYPLLRSSLEAMRGREPGAAFITITGDLIAHDFVCRYRTLFPRATDPNYQAFVEKTIQFVVGELRGAFPEAPVYVSLGNNDTECGDYRMDAGGGFLKETAAIVAGSVPTERQAVLTEFPVGGYFSVPMAAPMRNTRLIVLNDLFLSSKYATCKGESDPAPASAEMSWLGEQLAQARQEGQRVWVMGHVPPGVNAYATVSKFKDICADDEAEMFLRSERLDGLLTGSADVVRLGLFAHTHMDEMRLLRPEGGSPGGGDVALKLVPSISPVDGNNPSFTVARIDPATAVLRDYTVVVASNQTGVGTTWSEEYDYGRSYHEPDFSAATVKDLMAEFRGDPRAQKDASQKYIRHYFKGEAARALTPLWPQYACSLDNNTAREYAACVCRAVH